MTLATQAEVLPIQIATKSLGKLVANMNLAKTVARDFEFTTVKEGTTIMVTKRGALVANNKVAGEKFIKQNPNMNSTPVVMDKHKDVTFTIDDVLAVCQNQATQEGYAEDAAIVLAETIETELAKLYSELDFITFDTSTPEKIDESLLAIRKLFVDRKIPVGETRYCYFDSTLINAILACNKYTNASVTGANGVIEEGKPRVIYGLNIFESQIVQNDGSPVTYHNLAYTKNSIVLATRNLPSWDGVKGADVKIVNDPDVNVGLRVISHFDADLGGLTITLDVFFGVGVVDANRAVEVRSN